MKAAVIGPGAMGCLFAARLSDAGIRTTLVDYKSERAARFQEAGIVVEHETGEIEAHPTVSTQCPKRQDFVLVLTKAYSSQHLRIPSGQPVLSLQNGLGNPDALCALVGSAHVLAGTTCEAATLVSEGRTRHVAAGKTCVGAWTSCPTGPVIDALWQAGFDVEETESPGQMIWEKVAVNAGINPLTALLGVPNGRLLHLRETRQLMRDLVVEAAKVAATEGYRFPYSLVERAEEICRQTGENISSMLQDIRAGKPTEIESISGEILRRAQLASLPTPRTRVILQLIKGLEAR